MVEAVEHRLEGDLEIREVHDPTSLRVYRTGHMDLHLEGMAVQPGTLMPFRHVGEPVGGLDMERLIDVHPAIIPCGQSPGKAPYNPKDKYGADMAKQTRKIRDQIIQLKLEHHDLDVAIARLAEDPTSDELQVSRLKKRKLQLKDYIARLESMLIPDLDA
jgi:hypothetical protein